MPVPSSSPSRTMIACALPTGRWVPHGCETILVSVRRICDALEGTSRDFSEPILLDEGIWASAVAAIWRAVDAAQLQLLVFDRARSESEIPADVTRSVPYLRKPHVLSLVFLRIGNSLHREFAARFGSGFAQLPIGFRKSEIEKLEIKIRRTNPVKDTRRPGRPPNAGIRQEVEGVVEGGRWSTSKSLKALTREVSRELKRQVSSDTVGRALDRIFEETNDSRFKRPRRKKR